MLVRVLEDCKLQSQVTSPYQLLGFFDSSGLGRQVRPSSLEDGAQGQRLVKVESRSVVGRVLCDFANPGML